MIGYIYIYIYAHLLWREKWKQVCQLNQQTFSGRHISWKKELHQVKIVELFIHVLTKNLGPLSSMYSWKSKQPVQVSCHNPASRMRRRLHARLKEYFKMLDFCVPIRKACVENSKFLLKAHWNLHVFWMPHMPKAMYREHLTTSSSYQFQQSYWSHIFSSHLGTSLLGYYHSTWTVST